MRINRERIERSAQAIDAQAAHRLRARIEALSPELLTEYLFLQVVGQGALDRWRNAKAHWDAMTEEEVRDLIRRTVLNQRPAVNDWLVRCQRRPRRCE